MIINFPSLVWLKVKIYNLPRTLLLVLSFLYEVSQQIWSCFTRPSLDPTLNLEKEQFQTLET